MVIPYDEILGQVEELKRRYSKLQVHEVNNTVIRLVGPILVYRCVDDFTLRKEYSIEIVIPLENSEYPYVIDTERVIDSRYSHCSRDGRLCLETEFAMVNRFVNGFNLLEWMEEYVESYFVVYEYWKLYGCFINGERSHGSIGVIESYRDVLLTKNNIETLKLMYYIAQNEYDGHATCPCGSGKYIRKCHGKKMLLIYNHKILRDKLREDIEAIEEEISNIETDKDTNSTE